jgi:hypothetical protein
LLVVIISLQIFLLLSLLLLFYLSIYFFKIGAYGWDRTRCVW